MRLRSPIAVDVTADQELVSWLAIRPRWRDVLSAEPCSAKLFSTPTVVSSRNELKMLLSMLWKGTLSNLSRRLRDSTSVVEGSIGTLSVAKSPVSRLPSRDPAAPFVVVMEVCRTP